MGSKPTTRTTPPEESAEEAPLLSQNPKQTIYQNGNSTSPNKTKTLTKPDPNNDIPLRLKFVRGTIYVLCLLLNVLYIPLFIFRAFQKRRKCPPINDPILRIPALELAEKIRKKKITCGQVIQAYISRIKEVNPLLNAIVEDRFAEALEDAKKVDNLITSLADEDRIAREYPLLGIPITVKGSLAVKGMMHTSGTVTRKKHKAERDAGAVELARRAGAIPLLVSNIPELCMSWETSNKLIGTTRNPYDTTRTCGGSSGGEASLLASGASLLGIGSDIAGSLRLPAHYCGVWGHKPTPEVVSHDGHYPSCPHRDKWGSIFTVGPMARYAKDLRALLAVISKPEQRASLNLNQKIDFKNIKVYYSNYEHYYWQKPNIYCQGAVKKVVDHLKNLCKTSPTEVDLYLSQNAPDLASFDILTTEDIDDIFDGNSNGVFTELFRYVTFRSKHTFMAIACGFFRKLTSILSDNRKTGIKKLLSNVREEYENILRDNGVFIVPSFPTEAPKHGDVLRTAIYAGYMTMFNSLGFPVTNCPVGVTNEGLPVGVQVVSMPYGDNLTLTVAEEIEKAFGGWIEPRRVN